MTSKEKRRFRSRVAMTLEDAVNSGWIIISLAIIFICLVIHTIFQFFTCSCKDELDLDKIIDDIEMKGGSVKIETVKNISEGINHGGESKRQEDKTTLQREDRRLKCEVRRLDKRSGGQLSVSFAEESWIKCEDEKKYLENITLSPYTKGLKLDRPFITLKVGTSKINGAVERKKWREVELGLERVIIIGDKVENKNGC
jgi:hypothetical protein